VRDAAGATGAVLDQIYDVIRDRKRHPVSGSYVAALFAAGLDRILKKLAEESGEVLLAAKNGKRAAIVWEMADLWFHSLVALGYHGIPPAAIYEELERRVGARPGRDTAKRTARRTARRAHARSATRRR